jgi:hypothetical protein
MGIFPEVIHRATIPLAVSPAVIPPTPPLTTRMVWLVAIEVVART